MGTTSAGSEGVEASLGFIGEARATGRGRPVDPPHRQTWRLLAYLVVNAGRPIERDQLADAVWGAAPPKTWPTALRVAVKKVRDFLGELGFDGGAAVRTAYGCYQLDLPASLAVDVAHMAMRTADAERALDQGRTADALAHAEDVRSVFGDFLPGEDGAWIDVERTALVRMYTRSLEVASEAARLLGDTSRAVSAAREAVVFQPMNETAHRLLIEGYEAAGDRARALGAYDACRRTLADELGVEPSAETQAVYLRILRAQGPTGSGGRLAFPGPLRVDGPFVGRRRELDRLGRELLAARQGALRTVVVGGGAGIGKTRLVAEFAQRAFSDGSTVVYGRCDAEAIGPYQPFVEALARLTNAGPRDRVVPAELAELVPGLVGVVGSGQSSDPRAQRYRLFETISDLFADAVDSEAGLVCVLDDLQWAERPTLLLLEHVIRSKSTAPIMIVATVRVDETSDELRNTLANLRRSHPVTEIDLAGMSANDVSELVEAWDDTLVPELGRAMHDRTDGNPFFVIELLRHLSEGSDEVALETQDVVAATVPPGIRAVIRQRVSRLPAAAQNVLTSAAVAGRSFDLRLIELLVPDVADVPRSLEEAVRAGLLDEINDAVGHYRFSHDLVRQVLYDDLTATRRARIHQQVGDALERMDRRGPMARIDELAHHFAVAAPLGLETKAQHYLELAGQRALEVLAFEDAIDRFARALTFAGDDDEIQARLMISLADAHGRAGHMDDACWCLFDAIPSAARSGMLDDAAEALVRATSFLASNWNDDLWERASRSLGLLPSGDSVMKSVILSRSALATQAFGVPYERFLRTRESSVQAHEMAIRLGHPTSLAAAIQARILCDASPELLADRRDLLTTLIELTYTTDDEPLRMNGHLWLAMEHLARGDLALSEASVSEFERLGAITGHPWTEWRRLVVTASLALIRGDLEAADDRAHRALRVGLELNVPQAALYYGGQRLFVRRDQGRLDEVSASFFATMPRGPLAALVHAELGELDEATAALHEAVPGAFRDAFNAFPNYWVALTLLSYACDIVGDSQIARRLFDKLSPYGGRHVVVNGLGMYWGPAELALGGLAATLGWADDADRLLVRAIEMCREVRSPTWTARALVRLATHLRDTDRGRAQRLLDEARGLAESVGMRALAAETAGLLSAAER